MQSRVTHVVPTHGETPGRIDEASRVRVETTRDGIHHSEFTKSVHDVEDHDTSDSEAEEDRGRATLGEGTTRTDEETSTDGTTDGNKLNLSVVETTLKLVSIVGDMAHVVVGAIFILVRACFGNIARILFLVVFRHPWCR